MRLNDVGLAEPLLHELTWTARIPSSSLVHTWAGLIHCDLSPAAYIACHSW